MDVATAYGVGITGDLPDASLDALARADRTVRCLEITVKKVSSIKADPGTAVRPCAAQGRSVHIVPHPDHVAVQVDRRFGFRLWLAAQCIECDVLPDVPDAQIAYWILQQILPLFLLLDGSTEFLHAMAISKEPRSAGGDLPLTSGPPTCIAFLGKSHAGKSTLLSHFLTRKHALVTDDHLALSRQSYTTVLPAPPFYRPYRASEDLGVRAPIYSAAPTELRRLYLLEPAAADAPIRLEPLTGIAAIAALFPNIHYSLHNAQRPDLFPLVEDRFHGLADIVRRVPFARLHVPRSLERLPAVYDFIQNDRAS